LVGDIGEDFAPNPAPAPKPVQYTYEDNTSQQAQEIVPDELQSDTHDNTDTLIANLANKIKMTDKEMQ